MKLNKLFLALLVPVMALTTACQEDLVELADQISTDKGVYEASMDGGDITVKLLATEDWTASVAPATSLDEVDGITVSPASGSASDVAQTVTIHVPANNGYNRSALVSFVGARLSGAVTVTQPGAEGERVLAITCAEFNKKAVDASIFYELTGEVTKITDEYYNDFYINDGTVEGDGVYVYGLYEYKGAGRINYYMQQMNIREGDILTLRAYRGEYNGTIEAMQAYYVKHEKSQKPSIALDIESYEASAKGETFELNVSSNKVTWTLTADVDWITFEPASGSESAKVKVTVAAGEGGTGTITLSADGLDPKTCVVTRADVQILTAAEFNAMPDGDKAYQISGIITRIVMDKNDDTKYNKYGNFDITDATGTVYVYGLLPEKGGATGQDVLTNLGLKLGDYITVTGPKSSYNGAPQGKNMWYGSHIESITVAEFLEKEDGTTPYVLKGKIANVVMDKNDPTKPNAYGNFDLEDETGSVYVYGLYEDYTLPSKDRVKVFNELGLKAGDIVTLFGPKTTYNGTIEVNGSSYVFHEEGEAEASIALDKDTYEASAAGETFDLTVTSTAASWTLTSDVDWITIDPASGDESATVKVTVAAGEGGTGVITLSAEGLESKTCTVTRASTQVVTCAEFNAMEDGDTAYQISGIVTQIVMDKNDDTKYNKYGNFYITDATGTVYVYGLLPEKGGASGQDVLTTKEIKVGDYITVTGPKSSYNGSPQGKNMWYESHIKSLTVAEFLATEVGSTPYVLKGEITNVVNTDYGNFDLKDESGTVYVYGIYEDYTASPRVKVFEPKGLKEGDIVTLIGPHGQYNGTDQVNKSSYVLHEAPAE